MSIKSKVKKIEIILLLIIDGKKIQEADKENWEREDIIKADRLKIIINEIEKKREKLEHMHYLLTKLNAWKDQGYRPQKSIHSPGAVNFSKNCLKADYWTVETLLYGFELALDRPPSIYSEPNNKSAKMHMAQLRDKFKAWEEENKVYKCKRKPDICSPLSMVAKIDHQKHCTKFRPVLDHSRMINLCINDRPTKVNDFTYFEHFFEKDGFGTTFDLESMFHQLRLTDRTAELFGCAVEEEDGTLTYYKFGVLMFGNKDAVRVMTRMMKPAMDLFRDMSIKSGCFIDDGLIVNKDPEVLTIETKFVLETLQLAGWQINTEKTRPIPSQNPIYQGFILDFVAMEYRLPVWKCEAAIAAIDKLLEDSKGGRYIQVKEITSVLGKCISAKKSHGPSMQVALRHCQHEVGKRVMHRGPEQEGDWTVFSPIDDQAREELEYVKYILMGKNGYLMPQHIEYKVFEKHGVSYSSMEPYRQGTDLQVFCSDASDKFAFVYEADKFQIVEEFEFSEEEQATGSGHRELLAILKTLRKHSKEFAKAPTRCYWITDSKNVKQFLKRGSRSAHIQKVILEIKQWETKLNVLIIPIWKPRTTRSLELADLGSKMYKSTDEWSIDRKTFLKIQWYFRMEVTIDAFATSANAQVDRFYSIYPQVGSEGLDFFAQDLSDKEVYWICPPVKLVLKTIMHILQAKQRVVAYISFPEWKSSQCW